MFIQDLKHDFYNRLIGKRILIVVNYDIDAICASKILQSLFKYDNMLYTMVPIMGLAGLKRAYNEHQNDVKYVLLINCGGCIDVIEVLQPEDDVEFFICDSHRPYDVCNIYSDRQVRIIGDPAIEENIPAFEAIFNDSDDEVENDDDDDDNNDDNGDNEDNDEQIDGSDTENVANNARSRSGENRLQKHERRILKQRQRVTWEKERDRIMFEYSQFSFYGRSAALIIFELAWKLSKDNMDLLWWAIVGITEQLIMGKIESSIYALEIGNVQSHVSRLTNKTTDQNNMSILKINFEKDLHLALYRHWTVSESIRYSMYSACKLRLWTMRGEKKLLELLAEMGLPITQARQTFTSMDLILRQEFFSMIEKLADKYDIPDIIYGSFTLSYGYRNRYSASDYVHSMLASLESMKKDKTPEDCFLEAMDSLSRDHKDILGVGIKNAQLLLTAVFKQVQSCLEAKQVHSTGSFFYYIINEENSYFSYPYGLIMLSRFILNGHVATSRGRHAPELPLIASCPIDDKLGMCLLVGIPPVSESSAKNFFGKAFEQAASNSNSAILQDSFESSIMQILRSDLTKFLDALTVLLSLS